MTRFINSVVVGLMLCSAPVAAQTVLNGNHSVQGSLCAGIECTNSESFFSSDLKVKSSFPYIFFEDSSAPGTITTRDWSIRANDTVEEFFAITDEDTDRQIFRLQPGARHNSIFVNSNGEVGLGTSMPLDELHIVGDDGNAGMTLESTNNGQKWGINNGVGAFYIQDHNTSNLVVSIGDGAPARALSISHNGNIGMGTASPMASLELSKNDTFNFFRISAQSAAVNKSVDIVFTGGPLGTGQLRYNIVEGTGVQTPEMTLDADGNMVLTGALTTTGPTCAGGCDQVFDADYPLPSITQHQATMWEAGHLPSMGPTLPGQPVNLTETVGNILNELEHAHIFIGQQQQVIAHQQVQMTQMLARLDALEAQ